MYLTQHILFVICFKLSSVPSLSTTINLFHSFLPPPYAYAEKYVVPITYASYRPL